MLEEVEKEELIVTIDGQTAMSPAEVFKYMSDNVALFKVFIEENKLKRTFFEEKEKIKTHWTVFSHD